jgi:hypothetical protein
VDVTAGSFRRTSVAAQKCRRRHRDSDEISLRLRRTRQSDLRSNVREPRKSDHAADTLADIMVDALNPEASRETSRASDRASVREHYVAAAKPGSPDADHTPPMDE